MAASLPSLLPARADEIEALEGAFEEPLQAIRRDAAGDLVLETARRKVPAAEVKEVRFAGASAEPRPTPGRLFLVNGDELPGEVLAGDDDKVAWKSAVFEAGVEVPLERIRAVAFTGDEKDLRELRAKVLPLDAKTDIVITRSWQRTEGVLERIDETGVRIESEALGKVTLSPEKALAVRIAALGKPPAPPEGIVARLELLDGGLLSGALVSFEGGIFKIDAFRPGLEIRAASVRAVSFSGGRFLALSDLAPRAAEEKTALPAFVRFPWRADRSVIDQPLRLDGRTYRKGVGVHAYTRLTYDLGGAFVRFRARIGLDDSARGDRSVEGTVTFQVLVDGKPALGEKGIAMRSSDPSRPIDVDVAGAKTLALVADFGESGDVLARGNWADAYLIRK